MTGVSALIENLNIGESTEMEWGSLNGGQCTISDYQKNTIVGYANTSLQDCLKKVSETAGGYNLSEHLTTNQTATEILTPEQIIETEELAQIYTEFLWQGILPLITLIFALTLVIKIIKNITSIE